MSSGESGGGMSGDDPNDPNSPTYGGIAAPDSRGDDADNPSSFNYGGLTDLYAADAALQDINQEPSGLQDVDAALAAMQDLNLAYNRNEPRGFENYDVSGQIFGFGQPNFAPAGTPQESYLDRAEDAIKGFVDRQTTPSSIGGKVAGVLASMATGNPFAGYAVNQAFQAIANQEPQDPFDANNPNSPDYTGPVDLSDPVDNGGPDPYARRRYILPTPQTMAPEAPMVNNPLPLTPYDYQKQVWNGNVFTPAPIRRL
mgnify:FL=1